MATTTLAERLRRIRREAGYGEERKLRLETLMSMFDELDEPQQKTIEEVIKGFLRSKPGGSGNDPFKIDPPKDN